MKNLDRKLHDALISYQLDLRRLEAGTREGILKLFNKMQKDLVAELAKSGELSKFNKARKKELLRQTTLVIDNFYKSAQAELEGVTEGLADAQIRHATKMLKGTAAIAMAAELPPAPVMERIGREALIEGGLIGDWWKKMSVDTAFKVSNAIRQGTAQGETNSQIIVRVTGKAGEIGALSAPRANVAALVQTTMQTVANDARLAVFEANKGLIKEVIWFSAMDGHVCPRCIALSGRRWKNEQDHDPVGHVVPFRNPPIHWNDRCVLLPVTKTFRELGIDVDEVPEGQRASKFGPVASKTTFDEFLKRQSVDQQDEQLGAGRAQMWRDGKITLAQLIDGKGRELTLDELRKKYD